MIVNKLFFILSVFFVLDVGASELRCGWLANPSPSNIWLLDSEGEWIISIQGGYSSEGLDKLKDFPASQYIKTGINYGYGCSCLTVETNKKKMMITNILKSKNLTLLACKTDRKLQEIPNLN
ncbi:hypothetical protein CE143_16755 [Photorhabdus luminescens]|uniref:DUF4087 domain-containing protein n=1 Tax=Photorhabdus akhurstii TaxID=171438 RepID=A0ABX8LWG5_9GAMM|nr:hypothetical protein B0X70_16760 [Photorhabdus akhurstii]UJD76454.1 hypothetical protein CE143_16755 [Photorhabdus luminescens]